MYEPAQITDHKLVVLAREIAMDVVPLETILRSAGITSNQWEAIQKQPRFQEVLSAEMLAWESAVNTADRVKLKAAACVEDALLEMHGRLHDRREPMSARVELFKSLAKLGGLETSSKADVQMGERFQLTINIGDGRAREITSEVTRVIEHEDL